MAIQERIDEIGFGKYQLQQGALVAAYFVAEAAEIDIISPLTSAWGGEWSLGRDDLAALASVGFFGFAVGTFVSGIIGDNFGRRVPILAGYVGTLIGAVGMWGAPSAAIVGVFRALTGFSVGIGVPATLTIIAEVAPPKHRSDLLTLCYVALTIGALWADLGLFSFLPDLKSGDWRTLCLWSAVPAGLALPVGLWLLNDTPSFYAAKKDFGGMNRTLAAMAETNGKRELAASALSEPSDAGAEQGDAADRKGLALDPALLKFAVPLLACAAIDFAYNFLGFGIGYFFPLELAELAGSSPIPPVPELVIANMLGVVGLLIAVSAQKSDFGHKQILAIAGSAEFCAVLLLLFAGTEAGVAQLGALTALAPVAGVLALKLVEKTYSSTVSTVKGENFPSRVRVTALSLSGTSGRTGALLAPALIEETRGAPGSPGEFSIFFGAIAVVVFFATALSFVALPETKGRRLPD